MEFGRVEHPELVDHTLAPDPPATSHVLKTAERDGAFSMCFGTSQWHDDGYYGSLYPERVKKGEELHWYARQFNTIEFNPSFYAIPPVASVKKWASLVPDGFSFCCKVPRYISHAAEPVLQSNALDSFGETLKHFEDHLGPCFLQLPPHVKPDALPRYLRLLDKTKLPSRLFFEARHELWFTEQGFYEDAVSVFQERGIGLVISDASGRRDAAHMTLAIPEVMVRWVGNSGHASDFERLKEWALRIEQWKQAGLKRCHFFLHQPDPGKVPALAVRFSEMLSGSGIPTKKIALQDVQQGLF
jgi:uncharacterized protein YecE (DUF72 family)